MSNLIPITNYLLFAIFLSLIPSNDASLTINKRHLLPPDHRNHLRGLNLVAQTATTLAPTTNQQQQQQQPPPQELPDFSEPIGNQTVALGKDAQLSCKIENLGQFRTAWLRVEDKGILTIHNNIITRNYRFGLINNDAGKTFILTIKNVQPTDRGGYMCQINSIPMKYAIGYLDVLTPPVFDDNNQSSQRQQQQQQIDTQPTNNSTLNSLITVKEGGNVSLSCKANGHPQPVITWRREDNEPIMISDKEEFQKVEGSTIQLNQVSRLNSGAYLCIASNGVQPSASKRLVLDVQFSPIIKLPQTEIGAHLNQAEVKLSCIIESNPASSYYWIKVARSGKVLTRDDDNNNNNNEEADDDYDLAFIEHEQLLNSDKYDISVNKNNLESSGSEKMELNLSIRRLDKHDFGYYKCLAKNSLGLQSNKIRLYEQATSTSSFSLNNMFRIGSNSLGEPTNNSELDNKQQLNDQQDNDNPNRKQGGSTRTYTRSSWVQKPVTSATTHGRIESSSASKALLDSQSSSSSPINLLLYIETTCILIALLAQIVNLQ